MINTEKHLDLQSVLLFLMAVGVFSFNINTDKFLGISGYLWTNALIGLFIGWSFILCMKNNRGKIFWSKFYTFSILFVCVCFVSVFYSYARNDSLRETLTMVLVVCMSVFVYQYIVSKERLRRALKIYAWAGFVSSIYMFLISGVSLGTISESGRLGEELNNQNTVGITFVLVILVAIHLLKTDKTKKRWIYLIQIIVMGIAVLFTGSRNAFVLLLASLIFNLYLNAYQNHWNIVRVTVLTAGVVVLCVLLFYAVMNIPALYNVLGERLESFSQIMRGEESSIGEQSTQNRGILARRAFRWFLNSPLWAGHGVNAFSSYNSTFANGAYCYCHVGYLEILCGTGILGLILFYGPFLMCLKSGFANIKKSLNGEYCILLISLVLIFLMGEIFAVHYFYKMTWILIGLIAGLNASITEKNRI